MPKIGDVVAGKYRLESVAGEGGMGIVYAAEHLILKQRVAVKILLPHAARSDAVVERFAREAQAAARIQSDHVARVLDAGSLVSGAPFLVMEYLEGCDLEELLELHGRIPVVEVVDYAIQACEALAHAHVAGIVHRDLKPANLFLSKRPDGGSIVKMLDFGISKSMKSKPTEKKLTGAHVLGSPVYISPEQLRNAKAIDARADIWSLGIVLYELLTGAAPFDGDGVGEIFAAILEKDCVPSHQRNAKVPVELSAVVAKCLRRNPAERWQDVGEVAKALAPFGSGAWNDVVPRIEQLFARAKMLKAIDTPVETRIVVDAIAAAAERARTTGARSMPPPPSQPKPTVVDTTTETLSDEVEKFAPRRARKIAWAAAAIAVVGGVALLGFVATGRAREPWQAVTGALGSPSPDGSETPQEAAPQEAASAGAAASAGSTSASSSGAASHTRAPARKQPAKGTRPKFLKTRE